MDTFDINEDIKPKREFKFSRAIINLGSLFFLGSAVCMASWVVAVILNPQGNLNPWPPNTLSLTSTFTPSPDDVTPTATGEESAETPTSTQSISTATITPTEEVLENITPTSTQIPPGEKPFGVQIGNPIAIDSSIFYPEEACNFMGVYGQVFNKDGASVVGQFVELTGSLDSSPVNMLSSTAVGSAYGIGAYYEFILSDSTIASTDTLQVQLLDQENNPISDQVPFDTFEDCTRNLILINFVEFR